MDEMILESVENGPLIWPTIEENGVTSPKKYSELSAMEAIQADCDIKVTYFILQGLPPEVYALVSNHKIAKELWERIQLLMQGTSLTETGNRVKHSVDESNLASGICTHVTLISFMLTWDNMNFMQMRLFNSVTQLRSACIGCYPSDVPEPTLSSRPTIVEVPKELPKVSMVNTSLKKLKHHLAGFDVVVKERTTPTAITEGSWGFEHTKACFRDEIIPFVKALKDLFNTFNQYLVDELSEVQNVFHQMEQAVEQHRLESKTFEVKMNQVLNENERLLEQVLSKDIVNIIVNSSVNIASVNVHECEKCLKLETELLKKKDFVEKEIYDKLFKSFTTLEKHCISLEVDTQLNQEIFQRDNSVSNQSAPSFDQLFELNELKAQSQEKDTVIKKLKERINALSGKKNEDKIKQELEEIETINIELDHRVTKLIAENEHLKQTYKQLFDSIKLAPLKDDLRKLKGKAIVDNDITKHPSDPEMLKFDVEPITPKLLNKQTAHSAYMWHTQEETIELLTNISNTWPSINNPDGKLVAVTLETDIQEKDEKRSQKRQNRARNGKA
ncbi:hypothetical protein Tco_0949299 [Tanacetum coccineum]